MAAKLKVYTAPIGFHDVYVAAPSKAAALRAWGSEHDLFARGIASIVTDPALAAEPLAKPGEIVRRSRGTTADQIAALPPDPPADAPPRRAKAPADKQRGGARPKPLPKPDRATLDAAERALAEAEARQADEEKAVADRLAALEREQSALRRRHASETEKLEAARAAAEEAYDAALRAYRAG